MKLPAELAHWEQVIVDLVDETFPHYDDGAKDICCKSLARTITQLWIHDPTCKIVIEISTMYSMGHPVHTLTPRHV